MEHSRPQRPQLAPTLRITPWDDPLVDRLGYDVLDRDSTAGQPPYCETFWLPAIGPTTLLLLRRANQHLETSPDMAIPTDMLPSLLGLGPGTGRSSRIADTIARAERFNFAELNPQGDELRVRTHLPPLPRPVEQRLPQALALLHRHIRAEMAAARADHPAGRARTPQPRHLAPVPNIGDTRHEAVSR